MYNKNNNSNNNNNNNNISYQTQYYNAYACLIFHFYFPLTPKQNNIWQSIWEPKKIVFFKLEKVIGVILQNPALGNLSQTAHGTH